MCGLVGIASLNYQSERKWLSNACDMLIHRGPDSRGEWWSDDGKVGLAHRRLSILDLSSAGDQPMHFNGQAYSIVFNGEIYNYKELAAQLSKKGYQFKSSGDTEVLLAAYDYWGERCLEHLNGMFAFALYDARKQHLFLARDRAGEKPLFYYQHQGTLYFTSELKSLLSNNHLAPHMDPIALDCYLALGYIPGDLCILKDFKKLPPAHAMTFHLDSGECKVWRYWSLPPAVDSREHKDNGINDEEELLDELDELLSDSVRRQLVADVPVGILLSGGVDSGLITALAAKTSTKVNTYTIRFPGYNKFDETEHARLISNHFGTHHTELVADPISPDIIKLLIRQFDEPMVDSSMIPTYMVSRLIREHCKVALGGDGGDELFGGYTHYSRLLWMNEKLSPIPRVVRVGISKGAEHFLPPGIAGNSIRNWLMSVSEDFKKGVPNPVQLFDRGLRMKLLKKQVNHAYEAEHIRSRYIPDDDDLLQRATRMDFNMYLAEDILVKVDRASMLNSLEIRAPFLDYRLVEFAFGKVPSYLKATPTEKKIMLKRLAKRYFPSGFDYHRKQGFTVPLDKWLQTNTFRNFFLEVLTDNSSIFNTETVIKLLKDQDRGRANGERLFALLQFELWRKEYNVQL